MSKNLLKLLYYLQGKRRRVGLSSAITRKVQGRLTIEENVHDKGGTFIKITHVNTVVKGAYEYFLSEACDGAGVKFATFCLGSDSSPTNWTTTDLGNQTFSKIIGSATASGLEATVYTVMTQSEGNDETYYEAGLKLSDGTLFARAVFVDGGVPAPKTKTSAKEFRFTWRFYWGD